MSTIKKMIHKMKIIHKIKKELDAIKYNRLCPFQAFDTPFPILCDIRKWGTKECRTCFYYENE